MKNFVAKLLLIVALALPANAALAQNKINKAARAANASGLLVICDATQTYIDDNGVHMSIGVKSDSGLDVGVTITYAFNATPNSIKNAARDAAKQFALDEEGTVVSNANISYMGCPTS